MSDEAKLMVRLEASTKQLTSEMAKASAVVKQRMREIDDQFAASNRKITDGVGRAAQSYAQGAKGINSYRFAIQNTSYQVGDFAVQVAGGTSATRAMAQQLPQLLGGLGVFGAVAGAAAAILIPLAGNLFAAVDPAEALTKSLSALSDAMGKLKGADAAASQPVMDMVKEYGAYAAEAQKVLDIQREIAVLTASRALGVATQNAAEVFGNGADLGAFSSAELETYAATVAKARTELAALTLAEQNFGQISNQAQADAYEALQQRTIANDLAFQSTVEYSAAIAELATRFGITEEAAAGLAAAAARVREADNTEDRMAATKALAEYLYKATDGLVAAKDEGIALYDQLLNAVTAGMDLAALDLASGIGAGADEAGRLAGNLQIAAQAWLTARSVAQQPGNLALDKYGSRGTASDRPIEDGFGKVIDVTPKAVGAGSAGRGGGGGAKKEPLFGENQKQIERLQREMALLGQSDQAVATLRASWEMLDRAKKEGLDLDRVMAGSSKTLRAEIEAQADSVGRLTAELAAQKINRDQFERGIDGIAGAMSRALIDGENLRAGLADVFRGIALDLAKSGIRQGLLALMGGVGNGGGGFLSGLLGGLPSFDGGTANTGSGARTGGVDGKGGFLSIMHPNEGVIDYTKGGATGGAQQVSVRVFVDDDGKLRAVARQEGARGGAAAANAVRRDVPAIMDNHQKRRG